MCSPGLLLRAGPRPESGAWLGAGGCPRAEPVCWAGGLMTAASCERMSTALPEPAGVQGDAARKATGQDADWRQGWDKK